jgi:hypothetical protein
MRRNLIAGSLAAALAASAGCYSDADVTADPGYGYAADPELEVVAPGVQVVDDLDYPVFYNDGFYWMWDGGFWYRSHSWRGGWVGIGPEFVPYGIRGIGSPLAYSHWHGGIAHGNVAFRGGRAPVATGRTFHSAATQQPHFVARGGGGGHAGGRGGHH